MRTRRALYGLAGIGLVIVLLATLGISLASGSGGNALQSGTVIMVNTFVDDVDQNGNCSIREAILAANNDSTEDDCPAGNGVDTIVIPAGTYVMTQGDFDVASPMIIRGAGPEETILDANRLNRTFEVYEIGPVTIQDLTIQNGSVDLDDIDHQEGGAGVLNYGTLILEYVKIASNFTDYRSGGGVKNFGDLTVRNSLFFQNSAYTGGGAIDNEGTVRISQTEFVGNSSFSDGVFNNKAGATLEIDSAQILDSFTLIDANVLLGSGNITIRNTLIDCSGRTALNGGGIWIKGGEALLENVTIENCASEAQGGAVIQDGGSLQIVKSVIRNTTAVEGGGIALRSGSLDVRESLLSGNVSSWGAAIYVSGGSGLVTNSTLAANSAGISGTVYVSGGILELHSVTLAYNTGGGLVTAGGEAKVHNSILAGNGPDCKIETGRIVSLGHNLLGNMATCSWDHASGDSLGSPSQPIDAKLGLLQDNGGQTLTIELLPGSPAMDDGDNFNCPATDQRGYPRPVDGNKDGNASCDKGAYEYQGQPLPLMLFMPQAYH